MARKRKEKSLLVEIGPRIIDCINLGLDVVPRIKDALKLNRSTVDSHLRQMEAEGKVHRVSGRNPKGGYINHWAIGPGEGRLDPIEIPKVILTPASANYPVIGRRDPLVAAIHGPANRYAARCTACGMEQGTGHAVNCLVQLVAA